jgi:hypothetical protein
VAETEIGGNEKFMVSGELLEARLGGLVRDYLTELVVRSIYNGLKWWPGIWTKTCDGRRKRKLLARLIVANSPAMNRHRKPSHCDVVKRVIAWRDQGKRWCPR